MGEKFLHCHTTMHPFVTSGKTYEVTCETNDDYVIRDDEGNTHYFSKVDCGGTSYKDWFSLMYNVDEIGTSKPVNPKTYVLLAGGGDRSALVFSQNYNVDEIFEDMKKYGMTEMYISHKDEDGYITKIDINLHEFDGIINEEFVAFLGEEFMDYDMLKDKDFYIVGGDTSD